MPHWARGLLGEGPRPPGQPGRGRRGYGGRGHRSGERPPADPPPGPEPETVKNRLRPILLTDHHDEQTERLTDLGAKLLNETKLPAVRQTRFADPEGNEFDLVTWQPE
jgi:Glyoxalase-like domain